MNEDLIASLLAAVEASPADVTLRVHLAEMLLSSGRNGEAIAQAAAALQADPEHAGARAVMGRAMNNGGAPAVQAPEVRDTDAGMTDPPFPDQVSPPEPSTSEEGPSARAEEGYDWEAAEAEVGGPEPMFLGVEAQPRAGVWDIEKPKLTLDDVGGLDEVKKRLRASFLTPLTNPKLRQMYGKSLRGGLLMYGPPGCGKTYLARAVAGEIGAQFVSVGITDVLDMYIGNSERNLHELFLQARANAPVVLFLDEIDALGARRASSLSPIMRTTINQLLVELDGYEDANDGVYVLAATNQPWDVDPALRRPGRLDRTVLVTPPDERARAAILQHHLENRPIEGIDLGRLAAMTDGLTGADLAAVCEQAAENALLDSINTGIARMITMNDLLGALKEIKPSSGEWFTSARNVVQYADPTGNYADLKAYMKKRKLL